MGDAPNQSTKKCWTCEARTSYDIGFCNACYAELPWRVQTILQDCSVLPVAYRGTIQMGIVEGLRVTRVQAAFEATRDKRRMPLRPSIDDVDIEI